jgi:polygalacturonase
MDQLRRDLIKLWGGGLAATSLTVVGASVAHAKPAIVVPSVQEQSSFNVRTYGATGDGRTIDTAAINKAIDAANSNGGGTVYFPAGVYASYSIHLKSNVMAHMTPRNPVSRGTSIRSTVTITTTTV